MYDTADLTKKKVNKCKRCGGLAGVKMKPLMYWVQCSCCGYSMRYFLNEESAITAWNESNRPPLD